jgi:hypothetical protein
MDVCSATPGRVPIIKNKTTTMNSYRGYTVHASAHRLPDQSFSANLLLERSGDGLTGTQYHFASLDYFSQESEALAFSRRWARDENQL